MKWTYFFNHYCLSTWKDVALDGWLLTLFPSDDYSKSASTQVAGSDLGALFGYYFFIPLNSEEFCNKYIFDTPRTVNSDFPCILY